MLVTATFARATNTPDGYVPGGIIAAINPPANPAIVAWAASPGIWWSSFQPESAPGKFKPDEEPLTAWQQLLLEEGVSSQIVSGSTSNFLIGSQALSLDALLKLLGNGLMAVAIELKDGVAERPDVVVGVPEITIGSMAGWTIRAGSSVRADCIEAHLGFDGMNPGKHYYRLGKGSVLSSLGSLENGSLRLPRPDTLAMIISAP